MLLSKGMCIEYNIEVRTGGIGETRAAGVRRSVPGSHQTLSYCMYAWEGGDWVRKK